MSSPAPLANTPLSPRREKRRAAVRAADELICILAQRFPAVFTGERRQPHRPLTRGVHGDLIQRGILVHDECRGLFRRYCGRRGYQMALTAGGGERTRRPMKRRVPIAGQAAAPGHQ
jgi:hypothetical protein